MSKIGVGVGEDFPVDEGAPVGEDRGHCGHDREAWRQWRAQKREWKHRMRAEWHARKHAMRDQLRREFADEGHRHGPRPHRLAIAAFAVLGLAALIHHHDR